MKRPKLSTITGITVVLTVLWCAWWLRDEPPMVISFTDLDIHSGDIRQRVCLCYEPIGSLRVRKDKISESRLSREARRLGLNMPAERAWRTAGEQGRRGFHYDYVYAPLVGGVPDMMLRLLDETRTPDQDRRVILEQFMTSLRTRDAFTAQEHGHVLMLELADRHGLDIFNSTYEDQLRRSEFWGDNRQDEAASSFRL